MKMKMMMSEHKVPAAILYPQLDSEQRKNEEEEEEEESSSEPIQTLPLSFLKRRRRRKEQKGRKIIIEFRELGWTRITTCCTRFTSVCFF